MRKIFTFEPIPIYNRFVWNYSMKQYVWCRGSWGRCILTPHRVLNFMSLCLHKAIEDKITILGTIFGRFDIKPLHFLYTLIYGKLCCYSLKEILTFFFR